MTILKTIKYLTIIISLTGNTEQYLEKHLENIKPTQQTLKYYLNSQDYENALYHLHEVEYKSPYKYNIRIYSDIITTEEIDQLKNYIKQKSDNSEKWEEKARIVEELAKMKNANLTQKIDITPTTKHYTEKDFKLIDQMQKWMKSDLINKDYVNILYTLESISYSGNYNFDITIYCNIIKTEEIKQLKEYIEKYRHNSENYAKQTEIIKNLEKLNSIQKLIKNNLTSKKYSNVLDNLDNLIKDTNNYTIIIYSNIIKTEEISQLKRYLKQYKNNSKRYQAQVKMIDNLEKINNERVKKNVNIKNKTKKRVKFDTKNLLKNEKEAKKRIRLKNTKIMKNKDNRKTLYNIKR